MANCICVRLRVTFQPATPEIWTNTRGMIPVVYRLFISETAKRQTSAPDLPFPDPPAGGLQQLLAFPSVNPGYLERPCLALSRQLVTGGKAVRVAVPVHVQQTQREGYRRRAERNPGAEAQRLPLYFPRVHLIRTQNRHREPFNLENRDPAACASLNGSSRIKGRCTLNQVLKPFVNLLFMLLSAK
jgi:hypothetical protein